MKSNNVININGKYYDTKTGKPLADGQKTPSQPAPKTVDGFTKNTSPVGQLSASKKVSSKIPISAPATHPNAATSRTHAAPKARFNAKRSTTLNRQAVKTPTIQSDMKESASTAVSASVESSALLHADSNRTMRAKTTAKSPAISRFGEVINTKPSEVHSPEPHKATASNDQPALAHAAKSDNPSKKEQLIQTALQKTQSQNKQKTRRQAAAPAKRRRLAAYAPGVVAALLIAGYIAYLNVPSISMKVAAYRAGFAATMPGYMPAGYNLRGPITYSPGQVSVNFASNTDDRRFSLKQQPTTWDSTALLENLVTKKSPNYLTYQDKGLTIYIFDGSNAVWVNSGKLYRVQGENSRLDTDQLLRIATSV